MYDLSTFPSPPTPTLIVLKDNTFSLESDCAGKRQITKRYNLTLISKNSLFKEYYNMNIHSVTINTDLYRIFPIMLHGENKSKVVITVLEKDLINMFKSDSVMLEFSAIGNIKPYIELTLNKNDLNLYLKECQQSYEKLRIEEQGDGDLINNLKNKINSLFH